MRRFAAWPLSRFPTSGKVPSTLFQRLEIPSECGLIPPLVASGFVDSRPGHVSSAGSRHFKHGPPRPPGKSPRVCACGANLAAICFSGGKSRLRMATAGRACRALFSFSRPAPLRLAQAGRRWGRAAGPPRFGLAAFTPRASVTPRRGRRVMPVALRSVHKTECGHFSPRSPPESGGFGTKNVVWGNGLEVCPRCPLLLHRVGRDARHFRRQQHDIENSY